MKIIERKEKHKDLENVIKASVSMQLNNAGSIKQRRGSKRLMNASDSNH